MGKRMFCLEPDSATAGQIQSALGPSEIQVEVIADGNVLFERLSRDLPNLVLMAAELPNNQSGFAICNRIKKTNDWAHVPVVLLSNKPRAIEDHRQLKWKADGYVAKPLDANILLRALSPFLGPFEGLASAPSYPEEIGAITLEEEELSIDEEEVAPERADVGADVTVQAPPILLTPKTGNVPSPVPARAEPPQTRTSTVPAEVSRDMLHLRELLNTKERDVLELQTQVDRKDREVLDHRHSVREVERRIRQIEQERLAMERTVIETEEARREAQERANEEASRLSKEIKNRENVIAARDGEIVSQKKSLAALETTIAEKQTLLDGLERDNRSLRKRIEELEADLGKHQDEAVRLLQRIKDDEAQGVQVKRALAIAMALVDRGEKA